MNADENKMLIGVYLRSSAAINDFFTASDGRGSDARPLAETVVLVISSYHGKTDSFDDATGMSCRVAEPPPFLRAAKHIGPQIGSGACGNSAPVMAPEHGWPPLPTTVSY
jgi:hypothetical protein